MCIRDRICPYGAYTCRDGGQIALSVQNEREWARFCNAVLKRPELVEDPRFDGNDNRNRNRDVLQPMIESAFAALDRAQMLALLSEADIASGAVNDVATLSSHPQLDRTLIQCPSGEIGLPTPPIRRSGENVPLGASPALGAHNAAIRREFAAPVAGDDQT